MVNVNLIGRLGMDSEIRETKNGGKYVTLRVATDEFRNGKNETVWLNVFDYSERALKMAQYWKKGTMLNVFGVETVGVYQSKQTGEWLPSRDIRAYAIDFVNGGGSGNTQNTTEVATTTNSTTPTPSISVPTAQATPTPQVTPSFGTVVDASDDLPF